MDFMFLVPQQMGDQKVGGRTDRQTQAKSAQAYMYKHSGTQTEAGKAKDPYNSVILYNLDM